MFKKYVDTVWFSVFAPTGNDNDPLIPEVWAAESLMVLYENLVAAQLVHRDFSDEIAQSGDTVNTRRPAKFVTKRKTDDDDVTDQAATSENVAVKLDQHHHVSFVIKDGEESKGMVPLRNYYLVPALQAIAQGIDEMILGQRYEFINNVVGKLDGTVVRRDLIDVMVKMDQLLIPQMGRNLLISAATQGDLLNIQDFLNAEKVGDQGTALREGSLGRKFNMDTYMTQNIKTIAATDVRTGGINKSGGYPAGTTTVDVDGFSAAIVPGSWITIEGDMQPQFVTASTGGSTPTDITISPGLKYDVEDGAEVIVYDPAAVNNSDGYSAGYGKELTIDGATLAPYTGQLISTGTSVSTRKMYGAMSTPTTTELLLNRPLDTPVANNDVIGLGPAGNYNFAFHRNAIALVSRPLATPASGTGARSAVLNLNGIGVRVTITYDGKAQGHRVTVDLLCGVKTLDTNLGVLFLA